MNLEQTHTTYNQPIAISASGANYDWNVSGRKTTLTEHGQSAAEFTKKVVTSKPAIVIGIVVSVAVLIFTAIAVITDMRYKAQQAKLQRESRIVVL